MSNQSACQKCGAATEGTVAGGLCPACLIELARGCSNAPGASGPPRPLSVGELAGRLPGLEVTAMIGRGGMGAVYRARQTDLDREVAVKVLPEDLAKDPTFVERFRREARALARLDHPNIVRVFGSGVADGLCYIVMELVDGVTLREAIDQKTIDSAAALRIVPLICEALAFAHSAGVVHRDIKPENILLGRGGTVKVADFGLAKLSDADAAETLLTATGVHMGTLRYMAPEQLDGQTADHRADIYALGVVFYELLTGRVPMGHFPPPSATPGVDPRIDAVVTRTLQRDPAERYQAASDIRTDLDRIISGLPPTKGNEVERPSVASASARAATPWRAATSWSVGREWKSRARVFGYPILHVAWGHDPKTGKKLVARGVIAVGDIAVGGLAIGGVAFGLLSLGGFAVGVTAFGGAAIGLQLAMGGAAAGGFASGGAAAGIAAIGGAAAGLVAMGGAAAGYVAVGGGASGSITWMPAQRRWSDPHFPESLLGQWLTSAELQSWLLAFLLLAVLGPLLLVLATAAWGYLRSRTGETDPNPMPRDVKRALAGQSLGWSATAAGIVLLLYLPFKMLDRLHMETLRPTSGAASQQVAPDEASR